MSTARIWQRLRFAKMLFAPMEGSLEALARGVEQHNLRSRLHAFCDLRVTLRRGAGLPTSVTCVAHEPLPVSAGIECLVPTSKTAKSPDTHERMKCQGGRLEEEFCNHYEN